MELSDCYVVAGDVQQGDADVGGDDLDGVANPMILLKLWLIAVSWDEVVVAALPSACQPIHLVAVC